MSSSSLNRRKSALDHKNQTPPGQGDLHLTMLNLNLSELVLQPIPDFAQVSTEDLNIEIRTLTSATNNGTVRPVNIIRHLLPPLEGRNLHNG